MKITVPITVDVAKLKKNLKEAYEETESLDVFLCIAILDQIERGGVIVPSKDNDCVVNKIDNAPNGYECYGCVRYKEGLDSPWCRTCYATDSGYGSNFERAASAAKKNESSVTNSNGFDYGCETCKHNPVDSEECKVCVTTVKGHGSNYEPDDDLTPQDKPKEPCHYEF